MKAMIRNVWREGIRTETYKCLAFLCPGCQEFHGSGLHLIPVEPVEGQPHWEWDGNLDAPTLSPSILTGHNTPTADSRCHSFLKAGVFEFLSDSTHSLAGQKIPIPDLPDWFVKDDND